jgi:hypothetical protein
MTTLWVTLGVLVGLVGIFLLYALVGRLVDWVEVRRLAANARTITWADARRIVLHGDGILIANRTSLPGKLWLITPTVGRPEFPTLFEEVRGVGILIVGCGKAAMTEIAANREFEGKVVTLDIEPF